jgi:hypothetical protein
MRNVRGSGRLARRWRVGNYLRTWWSRMGLAALLGAMLMLAGQGQVGAQATRTWVSGVGDDANPCSRTAPCKTFAGAISKTAASGEINCLDPGGFGAVTITKAITIGCEFTEGSILASGTNGVIVNAGVNDIVVLRGLTIQGAGTGTNGIRYLQAAALYIEECVINSFNTAGIDAALSTNGELTVINTQIRNNNIGARFSTTGGELRAALDNVTIQNNSNGLQGLDRSRVTISDSAVSGNGLGLRVITSAGGQLNVVRTTISGNTTGIASGDNSNAIVRLQDSTITNNDRSIRIDGSGQVLSLGNNMITGNATNTGPTGTIAPQ